VNADIRLPASPPGHKRRPWTWALAGFVQVLFAVALVATTLFDPPAETASLVVRWMMAAALLIAGVGVFLGFRAAYWSSVGLLWFFSVLAVVNAAEDRDAGSIVVAAVLSFATLALLWHRPRRARPPPDTASQLAEAEAHRRYLMAPRTRWWLLAASILFTLVGFAISFVGSAEEKPVGIVTVLFFGVGGLVMILLTRKPRRRHPEVRIVQHGGLHSQALVFPASPTRLWIGAAATAAWATAGVLMAMNADSFTGRWSEGSVLVLGIVMAALFGVLAVLALVGVARGTFLALLPNGILVRARLGSTFVPWEAMTEFGVADVRGNPFIGIAVSDPEAVETSGPARWSMRARVSRHLAGFDLTFPAAILAVPLEVVTRTVLHYLERPQERADIGSELPAELSGAEGLS